MADGDVFGNIRTRPGSRKQLSQFAGGENSAMQIFLYQLLFEDACWLFDDFILDTINLDAWVLGADSGTAITTFAAAIAAGGTIAGDTGTDDENFISIHGPALFLGDRNCGMELRCSLADAVATPAVNNHLLEIGFTDPVSDDTLPAINDLDTPTITNGATDVGIVVMDYSQTLKTAALVTEGSTASMVPTKTNLGTRAPVSGEMFTVRVQAHVNALSAAWYDANGNLQDYATHGDGVASQLEGGVLLQPKFIVGCKEASNQIDAIIDYIAAWADRYDD